MLDLFQILFAAFSILVGFLLLLRPLPKFTVDKRVITAVMLFVYSLLLAYVTVFLYGRPTLSEYHLLNLQPFIWMYEVYAMGYEKMFEQLLLNVLMFIPLGLLLPCVFRNLRALGKSASVLLLITVSIEIVQYFIGRSCDIDDVIMNFSGGVMGYLLFCLLKPISVYKRRKNQIPLSE